MSSFRRATPSSSSLPGVRPSPLTSLPLLSSGLSPLDDLLGHGLPLGSSSALSDSDGNAGVGELLLRYWVAQGVESGQEVVVVGEGPEKWTWEGLFKAEREQGQEDDDDETEPDQKGGMKIAFRYSALRPHGSTASASVSAAATAKGKEKDKWPYRSTFDLTSHRPRSGCTEEERARLHFVDVGQMSGVKLYDALLARIKELVTELLNRPQSEKRPVRIALVGLGHLSWADSSDATIYRFLSLLRSFLRPVPCASFALMASPPSTRLLHTLDAHIALSSFLSSPSLAARFPGHQGLLRVALRPTMSSLRPPEGQSKLRETAGVMDVHAERGYGYRVKRRRFVVEPVTEGPMGGADSSEPAAKKVVKKKSEKAPVQEEEDGLDKGSTVRFAGEQGPAAQAPTGQQKKDVKSILHSRPELLDF